MNYNFYVFTNQHTTKGLTLDDAIKEYKKTNAGTHYKAIGVTKNDTYSCDLLNNLGVNGDRISKDYTRMDNFKDDFLIKNTVISRLEKEFNLVK